MEAARKAYRQRMAGRLKQWRNGFDDLKAKAKQRGVDTKLGFCPEIAEIARLELASIDHLVAFDAANSANWNEVEGNLELRWLRLSRAVDAFFARMRARRPGEAVLI